MLKFALIFNVVALSCPEWRTKKRPMATMNSYWRDFPGKNKD
jgi:hypothetical protein